MASIRLTMTALSTQSGKSCAHALKTQGEGVALASENIVLHRRSVQRQSKRHTQSKTSPKAKKEKKNLSHTGGSTKAPSEMELELRLAAVGFQRTAEGLVP